MKNSFNIIKLIAALTLMFGLFSFKASAIELTTSQCEVHASLTPSIVMKNKPKHKKNRKAKRHAKRHGLVTHGCRGANVIHKR